MRQNFDAVRRRNKCEMRPDESLPLGYSLNIEKTQRARSVVPIYWKALKRLLNSSLKCRLVTMRARWRVTQKIRVKLCTTSIDIRGKDGANWTVTGTLEGLSAASYYSTSLTSDSTSVTVKNRSLVYLARPTGVRGNIRLFVWDTAFKEVKH